MSEREFPFVVRSLDDVLRTNPSYNFQPQWQRGAMSQVLLNPKFGEIRHVVVCDRETGNPLWDQPVHIEPVGAITVPVTKSGKIRLQQQPRSVVLSSEIEPRFPEITPENFWGRWFLDVPRGFPIRGEAPEQAAVRETFEEASSPVLEIVKLGEVNANATFFNHMISVFLVKIDEDFEGEAPKDVNEKVIKGDDYTSGEIKAMIANGEIEDALTLAALNLYFCSTGD